MTFFPIFFPFDVNNEEEEREERKKQHCHLIMENFPHLQFVVDKMYIKAEKEKLFPHCHPPTHCASSLRHPPFSLFQLKQFFYFDFRSPTMCSL